MIWPWLVALMLVWSAIGAVVAHAAYRSLSRSRRPWGKFTLPPGPVWDVITWVEFLVMAISAGAVGPVVMAIWARGWRFEIGRSR